MKAGLSIIRMPPYCTVIVMHYLLNLSPGLRLTGGAKKVCFGFIENFCAGFVLFHPFQTGFLQYLC